MKHSWFDTALIGVFVAAGIAVTGCGVTQKKIEAYEAQLKTLETKGVPDSILSSVRVYLSQIISGKKSGLGTVVRTSTDSVQHYLAAAEKWYESSVQTAKPRVDSLVKAFTAAKAALSGMQMREADSQLAIIDSLTKKNWYMQAQAQADLLETLMPQLLNDETTAKKVDAQIRGTTWSMSKKITGGGANAVQKNKISFNKDGSYEMSEEMKGQTKPTLKEDWLFQTSGTYALKGDTILLSTTREKRVRQNYVHLAGGREVKKIQDKPYDSTITNGSKDRFFTFDYLKENFKK
ncbi:MAG: hypothetical protein JW699_06275 [Chitinispirillaceae bacterium]|nr:hypothetical protein [Chitinispirillaceae bacterium]